MITEEELKAMEELDLAVWNYPIAGEMAKTLRLAWKVIRAAQDVTNVHNHDDCTNCTSYCCAQFMSNEVRLDEALTPFNEGEKP